MVSSRLFLGIISWSQFRGNKPFTQLVFVFKWTAGKPLNWDHLLFNTQVPSIYQNVIFKHGFKRGRSRQTFFGGKDKELGTRNYCVQDGLSKQLYNQLLPTELFFKMGKKEISLRARSNNHDQILMISGTEPLCIYKSTYATWYIYSVLYIGRKNAHF